MNYRLTFNLFAKMLAGISVFMAVLGLGALIDAQMGEPRAIRAEWALLISATAGSLIGGGIWWWCRKPRKLFGRREAMLLVAMSWIGGAFLAALPFFLWAHLNFNPLHAQPDHPFLNPVNCYFEAMSGLSTTGSTILTDISAVPMSLLVWRAMTQWLGGLGIVVLFVAVLPSLGAGGKKMFQVEAPGPKPEGVLPGIRQAARMLWLIYLGLTITETIALRLTGMNWAEALCHTFATLATGGFSTENASLAHFGPGAQIVTMVFMIAAGINFALYFQVLRGKPLSIFRDTELRVYLMCIAVAAVLVIGSVYFMARPITTTAGQEVENSLSNAVQYGLFTTISIQTTTGFCNADFNQWPFLAKAVLLMLMFIGGSAGSTGGGIKVVRIWLTFKIMWAALERAFRPNVVRSIKINSRPVDPEMRLDVIAYVLGVVVLFGAGAGLYMVLEPADKIDFTTAATTSAATLFNIGPGLARVGATENYAWFTDASKVVMSVFMAVGRLEVFAILVLLSPRFWRGN